MVSSRSRGFTYLTVLFIVAMLSAGLALAGEMWQTAAKREREAELLFVGNQYRAAIGRYYESTPGPAKRFPPTLEALLMDARRPTTQRYLRKLYPDPVGGGEWSLVKAPEGGIRGVYSNSENAPLKTGNFKLRDAELAGAARYADWKFVYNPAAPASPAAPAKQ